MSVFHSLHEPFNGWYKGTEIAARNLTASEEFIRFLSMEKAAGREVSARWDWIVPPMSPATTPVFHMSMKETASSPEFRMQEPAWGSGY